MKLSAPDSAVPADDNIPSTSAQPVAPATTSSLEVNANVTIRRASGSSIMVNPAQRGNPIIPFIRAVPWEYGEIVPDYQLGTTTCALFLSLRYHQLHPEYIHTRISKLGQAFNLRVLLLYCDVERHETHIKDLTKICIINNLTILAAFAPEEAGRYLELLKSFEHKPPDMIKERVSQDHMSYLTAALISVRGINKTDVTTLASNFGSFENICKATVAELSMCPGFGDIKAKRLAEALSQSFRVDSNICLVPSTQVSSQRRPV